MKIGIMSDLHMYKTVLTEETPWDFEPEDDVFYICAGDICEDDDARNRFVQKHYDHMFAINGNHDYYGGTFADAKYHTLLREVNGLRIAGATLWTDVRDNLNWYRYTKGLIDCHYISDITQALMIETHEAHKDFLLRMEADIVVSHHCPSYMSIHPKYVNDPLNVCFANDMTDLIFNMKKPPKLWVHGHTHEDFDYMIGETRVVCWPRGYKNERDNYWNYAPKIVEI